MLVDGTKPSWWWSARVTRWRPAARHADILHSWTSWKLSSYSTIKTEIADMNDAAKVNVNTRKMYSSQIFICVSCVLK